MQPACGDDVVFLTDLQAPDVAVPPVPVPPVPGPTLAQMRGDDAGWVFDEDAIHVYELTLAPEDWETLQATALDEQYFRAALSVDGVTFGEVGLRFKGSSGTLRRCRGGVGTPLCPKMSMKLKFDEFDDTSRFSGLKRLNFNSMLGDPSWLHERLAYQLYREMGVQAPRASHARVIVNGDDRGVFSQVEQIDGRFTDDRFAGGDGNLYKEQWPVTASSAQLSRALETNEESADNALMIRMSEELAAATPAELANVVERYWDADELFAYLAVDRATTNWDGATGYYCRGGGCYNHNYYIYQHEHEERFSLIPWDLDNTFRVVTPFEQFPMPLVVPDDCAERYPVFPPSMFGMAPGCDPIFGGLALMARERYTAQVARLLAGPFELERLGAWIDARVAQLAPHVKTDPYGWGEGVFQLAVETLRWDLPTIIARVQAEAGGTLERFRLTADAPNDFEGTSSLGLQLGVTRQTGIHAKLLVSLEEGEVLAGERSLALAFGVARERDRVIPWSRIRMAFTPDVVDLSARSGVRLRIQSDNPRVVRVAVDSTGYSQPGSELVLGWDIPVDAVPRDIELQFSEARFPAWASAMPETQADVLSAVTGLLLQVDPVEGQEPEPGDAAVEAVGHVRIDDITFLP
jgi:spore coat protein H